VTVFPYPIASGSRCARLGDVRQGNQVLGAVRRFRNWIPVTSGLPFSLAGRCSTKISPMRHSCFVCFMRLWRPLNNSRRCAPCSAPRPLRRRLLLDRRPDLGSNKKRPASIRNTVGYGAYQLGRIGQHEELQLLVRATLRSGGSGRWFSASTRPAGNWKLATTVGL